MVGRTRRASAPRVGRGVGVVVGAHVAVEAVLRVGVANDLGVDGRGVQGGAELFDVLDRDRPSWSPNSPSHGVCRRGRAFDEGRELREAAGDDATAVEADRGTERASQRDHEVTRPPKQNPTMPMLVFPCSASAHSISCGTPRFCSTRRAKVATAPATSAVMAASAPAVRRLAVSPRTTHVSASVAVPETSLSLLKHQDGLHNDDSALARDWIGGKRDSGGGRRHHWLHESANQGQLVGLFAPVLDRTCSLKADAQHRPTASSTCSPVTYSTVV